MAKPAYKRNVADLLFSGVTGLASFTVILLILGVLATLLVESWPAVLKFSFFQFLFTVEWNPVKQVFGAASAVYGTMVTTFLALLIAIPTAVGIAVFVTEIAPNFLKGPMCFLVWATSNAVDQKRADAVAALEYIRNIITPEPGQ